MKELSVLLADRVDRKKYGVVFALFILSMITYIDRTSVSTAKEPIAAELRLSDQQVGMIFSSFALGYAFMQIPTGWLADKVGPRVVLAGTVSFWSALTALTGAAWSFVSLLLIRFLFGIGEAAVFPGSARAIRNWMEPGERGRANGALFAGSRLGAALSYPLLVWMLSVWRWRTVFLVLGGIGAAWSVTWLVWFRDFPASQPVAQSVATQYSDDQAASRVTVSVPLALAMLQYIASNFTNFISLSWMFPYLKSQYRLTNQSAALYAMAPLLLGAMSQGLTGWAIDRLYSSPLRAWSRRLPGIFGFALAALALLGVTRAGSVGLAVFAFTIAIFGADMTISPSWVFCADIAGNRTASISGALNMFGSLGAFASANVFPFLDRRTGSSSTYFLLATLLDLAGMLCWFRMRSVALHLPVPGVYAPENGR